jgi:hypothetical protein
MSGEIQGSMESLRVPVVKLQRVEEVYPGVLRESRVSALCREKNFVILFPGFMWPKKSEYF